MLENPTPSPSTWLKRQPDWRIWLGLGITASWLLLGYIYVTKTIGWSAFGSLPADELGSFLEGAFAPLAFLWLVIGYFLQKKELEQNTEALKTQALEIHRTADQSIIQSEKMAESEMHARQEAFLQIANSVRRQLGSIGGLLFVSSQSIDAEGPVSPEEQSQLFAQLSSQDPEVFSRRLLEVHLSTVDEHEKFNLFYGTAVRARHSNNFIFTFERLLRRAGEVDPDQMIRDSLMSGAHGFIYGIAKRHQDAAPKELNSIEHTGRKIVVG